MRLFRILLLLLINVLFFISCDTDNKKTGDQRSAKQQKAAYSFVKTFLNTNKATQQKFTKALRPNFKDIQAIFPDTAIQNKARLYINQLFGKKKFQIHPLTESNQVLIWSASTNDFNTATGDAIHFPSNFRQIIPYLKEGTIIHRFKFVKDKFPAGISFEGLVRVNDKWVIFPKIWKIVE